MGFLQHLLTCLLLLESNGVNSMSVLVTETPFWTQWTCFHMIWHDDDFTTQPVRAPHANSACCLAMDHANHAIEIQHASISSRFSLTHCLWELASVPTMSDSHHTIANYSWTSLETSTDRPLSKDTTRVIRQYQWHEEDSLGFQVLPTLQSPFHWESIPLDQSTATAQSTSAQVRLESDFSADGGMHRTWKHQLVLTNIVAPSATQQDVHATFAVFYIIPNGMFVDLENVLVPHNDRVAILTRSGGANQTTPMTIKIHTSNQVIDIEQPAFASGQHVLAMELTTIFQAPAESTLLSLTMNWSTLWHLRYPQPSNESEQWVHLPDPQVLGQIQFSSQDDNHTVTHKSIGVSNLYVGQANTSLPGFQRIWVGAGNDQDYDFVMWTTLAACWLGVIWMLMDISHVSIWENPK